MGSTDRNASANLPTEVFLDTSIHLALFKGDEISNRVRDTLTQFGWCGTASYTQLEYGNNILSTAAYLFEKLEKLGDLERLYDFMVNELKWNDKYKMWFFNLLRKHFNKPEATERAKRELRYLLRIGTDRIMAYTDEVRDGVKCVWTNQRGSKRWQKPNKCQKQKPSCRIGEFFECNRAVFSDMRDLIRRASPAERTPQLDGFAEVIDKAEVNPRVLRDYAVCKRFGDAIIAVESIGYKAFFTQNIRESSLLCKQLGQLLLYLQQDPTQPVALYDFRLAEGRVTEAPALYKAISLPVTPPGSK